MLPERPRTTYASSPPLVPPPVAQATPATEGNPVAEQAASLDPPQTVGPYLTDLSLGVSFDFGEVLDSEAERAVQEIGNTVPVAVNNGPDKPSLSSEPVSVTDRTTTRNQHPKPHQMDKHCQATIRTEESNAAMWQRRRAHAEAEEARAAALIASAQAEKLYRMKDNASTSNIANKTCP